MSQLQPRTNNFMDQKGVETQSGNDKLGRNMTPYDFMKIRDTNGKDGDRQIERILDEFKEKKDKISKVADLFVDKFVKKFGLSMPLHSILERANKYKKKYNLTDDEFSQVKRTFEEKLFKSMGTMDKGRSVQLNTNMARALGNAFVETFDGIVVSNTEDYQHLQEIIRTFTLNRNVYQNIVYQTSTYGDEDAQRIYDSKYIERMAIYNHVHPVIVAFFVPKISQIEERMLYANLAGIIVSRFNKTSIVTKPDHELLYSLVNDPNDVVCSNATPIVDLYNRCLVQLNLWRSVYDLRNGQCYGLSHNDLLTSIDNCKINNNDNPDMVILSDEGIILRRLFSTFSYRPIHVMNQPITTNILQNPYGFLPDQRVISSLPYITYRVPQFKRQDDPISVLTDSNESFTFSLDINTGRYLPNTTRIFNINGPLVYYVPRKYIDIPVPVNPLTSVTQLPTVFNNRISYHKIPISFEHNIIVTEKNFNLASVVSLAMIDVNNNNNKMITGNETTIFMNYNNDIVPIKANLYMPLKALTYEKKPFSEIGGEQLNEHRVNLQTTGCIFVYQMKQ
jgi:hypothetical protein